MRKTKNTIQGVLLLGTLPPPVGGVTIHTKRLLEKLRGERKGVRFVDLRPKTKRKYLISIYEIFFSDMKVVHYQLNNWAESIILSFICFITGKKFISTIHSFPVEYEDLPLRTKFFIKMTAYFSKLFIAPSETIKRSLLCAKIPVKKIKILDTFLPPDRQELEAPIPEIITQFVKGKKRIILANGSKLYLNAKGEDVYGLNLCIEACKRIGDSAFIFACPVIEDEKYFKHCQRLIQDNKLNDRILIYTKPVSLPSLFKIADVFVRPTASDSFGISVAEAINSGIPAVASKVCERASGTILFEKGNISDFVEKINLAYDERAAAHPVAVNYWKEIYECL